jgi:hypothetical protein
MSHRTDYVVAAWVYINKNPDKLNQWYQHLLSYPIEVKSDINKAACLWLMNIYVAGKTIAKSQSPRH